MSGIYTIKIRLTDSKTHNHKGNIALQDSSWIQYLTQFFTYSITVCPREIQVYLHKENKVY